MTAYQRIRRPPLLLPISPRIYIPARVVLRAGRAYSRLPSITLFVVTCCLLACLIAACCLLPAAYFCCRGWFRLCRLRVRALRPQIEHSLFMSACSPAWPGGAGGTLPCGTYLGWWPLCRPMLRHRRLQPASLRHAMLFAIAACSSALPLLASLLPVCMFELNTPLQLVLLSMSFFHPYIRTPPCNQHLPIADCLVSPSSMYFLALAPLPIRSLAIHCYQLPAGLLAIPQLSLVAVSPAHYASPSPPALCLAACDDSLLALQL